MKVHPFLFWLACYCIHIGSQDLISVPRGTPGPSRIEAFLFCRLLLLSFSILSFTLYDLEVDVLSFILDLTIGGARSQSSILSIHIPQLESTQRRGFSEIARVGIRAYPSL